MNYKKFIDKIDIERELSDRGIDYKYYSEDKIVLRCPIHNDFDYAMYINLNKSDFYFGIVKCFSCGYRKNIFEFLADYDNVLIREIYKKFKSDISINDIKKLKSYFKNKILSSNKKIKKEKIKVLKDSNIQKFSFNYNIDMKKYLKQRKIEIKTANRFGLMQDMRKKIKKRNKVIQNLYYKNIVFIYRDVEQRLRGIGRRKIGNKNKIIKLKNSDCTQMLYGLHPLLENRFFKQNRLILVEGGI